MCKGLVAHPGPPEAVSLMLYFFMDKLGQESVCSWLSGGSSQLTSPEPFKMAEVMHAGNLKLAWMGVFTPLKLTNAICQAYLLFFLRELVITPAHTLPTDISRTHSAWSS